MFHHYQIIPKVYEYNQLIEYVFLHWLYLLLKLLKVYQDNIFTYIWLNKSVLNTNGNHGIFKKLSSSYFTIKYQFLIFIIFIFVQFSSVTQSCPTLCDPMDCSTPGFPIHHQLSELAQTHVHWVSDAIQPSHFLSSPFLLTVKVPSIRVFSNEPVLRIRLPKYRSFSFNISPSNEYSGLISFRTDWFDLLVVQGTLKSLLQHHRSKASILQSSAFFIVQLSHPYMASGKIIALTRWTFVGKITFLMIFVIICQILNNIPWWFRG